VAPTFLREILVRARETRQPVQSRNLVAELDARRDKDRSLMTQMHVSDNELLRFTQPPACSLEARQPPVR
jgi:hypothetical protein